MSATSAFDGDASPLKLRRQHMTRPHGRKAAGDIRRRPYRVTDEPESLPTDFLLSPTMTITVQIPTIMRSLTRDQKYVETDGQTVIEAIAHLERTYPGLQRRLVQSGQLHRFVNIYVNDDDIRFNGGLSARLRDGDTITILPAVAGG
ncbi:MoaD/ThiS family protein [Burkholderia sp. ABCPW 14]|uniref:MoaD/ThiS family protein n=1 Tax=Burkholderia sp. ABCPW 14 TaxID=1637860 RepID=UPI0022B0E4A9|nr:MoaD/ThiS family protein [Burkholderia sp. ABCPW 14]